MAGLPIKKFYKWQKQPNGKYTIFQVEVIRLFESKERGKLQEKEADQMVSQVDQDREESKFPRVHIGHNPDGYGNRPGAGYLNNVQRVGDTIFADLVEIPPERFTEIQNLQYPARSAEYDKESYKLSGLALLESQPAYFDFPLLALEGATDGEKFQLNLAKFQKGLTMPELNEPQNTQPDDVNSPAVDSDENKMEEPVAGNTPGDAAPPWAQSLVSDIAAIKQVLSTLLGKEEEEGEAGEENEPKPVAMQSVKCEKENCPMKGKMQRLQERLEKMERSSRQAMLDEELQEICGEAGQDYQEQRQVIEKFSSIADKRTYLESLRAQTVKMQEHPASGVLSKGIAIPKGNPLQKYQNHHPQIQKKARELFQDWKDTVSQPNRRAAARFQANFPKPEDYIDFELSKIEDEE